jgi:hypothetical protein
LPGFDEGGGFVGREGAQFGGLAAGRFGLDEGAAGLSVRVG